MRRKKIDNDVLDMFSTPKAKKTRAKRTKTSKKQYFTKDHEKAIVAYAKSNDKSERERLYTQIIGPVLSELVDNLVFTFKFNTIPNIDELKLECKGHLATILDKFDESKGSKAFSYYSVVAKNWFIQQQKKTQKSLRRQLYIEDATPNQVYENEQMIEYNNYHFNRENEEFLKSLMFDMETWESDPTLKQNDKKVLEAIKVLFESIDDIEIFSKKAIYLYLREITSLSTKHIVTSLNRIRTRYKQVKNEWDY